MAKRKRKKKRPATVLSYGGGLDSWAMLLESIDRGEPPDYIVFSDVGDPLDRSVPGEWPSTLAHIEEIVKPLAEQHGIKFVHLSYLMGQEYLIQGKYKTLFEWFRSTNTFPGTQSSLCTMKAKIDRINTWLQQEFGGDPVEVWIGFGAEEKKRFKKGASAVYTKEVPGRTKRYPLMEWDMCRCRSEQVARQSGYPVPRKSACVFCPHASKRDFKTLSREQPELFHEIGKLESEFKGTSTGKMMAYHTKTGEEYGLEKGEKADMWLPEAVKTDYVPHLIPCPHCKAPQRATKQAGSTWLYDAPTTCPSDVGGMASAPQASAAPPPPGHGLVRLRHRKNAARSVYAGLPPRAAWDAFVGDLSPTEFALYDPQGSARSLGDYCRAYARQLPHWFSHDPEVAKLTAKQVDALGGAICEFAAERYRGQLADTLLDYLEEPKSFHEWSMLFPVARDAYDDPDLAEKMTAFHNYGDRRHPIHEFIDSRDIYTDLQEQIMNANAEQIQGYLFGYAASTGAES